MTRPTDKMSLLQEILDEHKENQRRDSSYAALYGGPHEWQAREALREFIDRAVCDGVIGTEDLKDIIHRLERPKIDPTGEVQASYWIIELSKHLSDEAYRPLARRLMEGADWLDEERRS